MTADRRSRRMALWTRMAILIALFLTAATADAGLLASPPAARAMQAGPEAVTGYQVTVSVGTGAQYDVRQGTSLSLPVDVSVTGAVGLAAATVLVQYDPLELRPVACLRQDGAPSGYCNLAWDTTDGLVRFNILSAAGVAPNTSVSLFELTFEPAPTATVRRVSSVTPLLESIADVQGNYMTSWMQGSTVRVMSSTVTGSAVYVGGTNSANPINITRGTTVPVRIEAVVPADVAAKGLGSASFSLSFDPTVVRPLECRPVSMADASGTCALHADHVSANLLYTSTSGTGLWDTIPAFEVDFTTGPTTLAGAESPLNLTLGAFADTSEEPITVRIFNNAIKVSKDASSTVPVLRLTPAEQYLTGDQRVTVSVMLDYGTDLAAGSWGIHYDGNIVQAETCVTTSSLTNAFCNATGSPGVVRMTVLNPATDGELAVITFRRHPQAKSGEESSLWFDVTNFADAAWEQLPYQTLGADIALADKLGLPPAVAMTLVGLPPYLLPQGDFIDFPIRFVIDPLRSITNLTGSIHYDPLVLRPTRCITSDLGGPMVHCNAQYDQQNGIIRFNLLSQAGVAGTLTPFEFRMEAASTSRGGARSPLHFTIEAISGLDEANQPVPRTWSATDETVTVMVPIPAPRVLIGAPELTEPPVYVITQGSTVTAPVWVDAVPALGAGTVEVRYDPDVVRATRCRLRSDLTPTLDGGFCSLLAGTVRLAFVSSQGINGASQLFDIDFQQAPSVVGEEIAPLSVVVKNFADTQEVPIPTSVRGGEIIIPCLAPPVDDLRIARSGDHLALSWSQVNLATSYRVWRAEENAYFGYGLDGSATVATMPASTLAMNLSYTDTGTYDPTTGLGLGAWADDLNHYYMVQPICDNGWGAAASNRVGKFTRPIGLGMNMLSLPLVSLPQLPYSYRVQDVLGAQLTGADSELYADRAWVWDTARQAYSYAWLIAGVGPEYDGKWWNSAGWRESTMVLPANTGFWVQSRHDFPQTIKMLGNVAEPNTQGLEVVENMQLIGSAYPDPVVLSLDAATFSQDGAHGADSELYADRIWYWDESRQQYEFGWLIAGVGPAYDGRWWDSFTWSESLLTLQPGVGYWYQRRGDGTFTWSNPGPMQ